MEGTASDTVSPAQRGCCGFWYPYLQPLLAHQSQVSSHTPGHPPSALSALLVLHPPCRSSQALLRPSLWLAGVTGALLGELHAACPRPTRYLQVVLWVPV